MKKIFTKIAASLLVIMLAGVMAVSVSYAWITLSQSPEINGISVGVSGRTTILLAPDTVAEVDGKTVHYPGAFGETLRLAQGAERGGELQPVSTADGLHWIIPTYDEQTGVLQDYTQFSCDDMLSSVCSKELGGGYYLYTDFWVVSPDSIYNLRVSMGEQDGKGSYLKELPVVEQGEYGLTLREPQGIINSSVRVGFLINTDEVSEESGEMQCYSRSEGYDRRYHTLRGIYQEENAKIPEGRQYSFSIYEPNATTHPFEPEADGAYFITRPLACDAQSGEIKETDIPPEALAVQEQSIWSEDNKGPLIEQQFNTAVAGRELSASEAQDYFYHTFLQRQVSNYLTSGQFFKYTDEVYRSSGKKTDVLLRAGAAENAIIVATERNVPQRVRMFIWIEGQDVDCVSNTAIDQSQFSLNIELAGATR